MMGIIQKSLIWAVVLSVPVNIIIFTLYFTETVIRIPLPIYQLPYIVGILFSGNIHAPNEVVYYVAFIIEIYLLMFLASAVLLFATSKRINDGQE